MVVYYIRSKLLRSTLDITKTIVCLSNVLGFTSNSAVREFLERLKILHLGSLLVQPSSHQRYASLGVYEVQVKMKNSQ